MTLSLSALNLVAEYPSPAGGALKALGPLSFEIAAGQFVCLVGPSGCGKSTLIRILAGLQHPASGSALLDKVSIDTPSRYVGVMSQESSLMPWRTVVENIALPLELAGVERGKRLALSQEMLLRLGLTSEFAEAYPAELSGGMAQRVALGRVLIQNPDVLLLDEPFGALDSMTREQISIDFLEVWATDHQTVVMVTHDIDEAVLLADRILVFSRRPGQIIADIPITLPRPRRIAETYSELFGEFARKVRDAIHNT